MKFTSAALSAMLSASALAYPGMGADMSSFHKRGELEKRAGAPPATPPPANIESATSPIAQAIKSCLDTSNSCEASSSVKTYVAPGPLGSSACAADTCCVWDSIAADLVAIFKGCDGQCTEAARQAIRLGFHDAGAWSTTSGFGGADGSMLISPDEFLRPENNGMQPIIATYRALLPKYSAFGVGAADFIQFGATVATVTCPLGARILTYVGRQDGDGSSPEGLLPDVHSDADTLIDLFANKTISAGDLAALVGAHSASVQTIVDANFAGAPQDSTPGVWDVEFYTETPDPNAPSDIFKFPSDVNLAADPRTSGSFNFFGTNSAGQAAWNDAFARAYVRLSLLGVPNIDNLVDCTAVIPSQITSFVITPNSCNSNTTSSASSAASSSTSSVSSASGVPHPSGNSTGSYPYSSATSTSKYTSKPTLYSTIWTTSVEEITKVHTYTTKGSVSKSYEVYTTTTVCAAIPTKVITYKPTITKTVTVNKSYFAGPSQSYVYKPIVTAGPSYSLAYASCQPSTVYTTVTVY